MMACLGKLHLCLLTVAFRQRSVLNCLAVFEDNLEEEIVASDKYLVENGLLIIHSLIPSDGGVYTCVASNVVDEKRHSINLTIFSMFHLSHIYNFFFGLFSIVVL